ncbi:hypothetical protein FHS18_002883 [Paenibacillus phyllosphaerae]|uniref:DUF1835 domain-containing protein n=1 Tax=Paenibacillus phyllosphaerae TaxID=274593 RepID=A0A7W5FN11_9BACL|nr:DUF1835 domain-containing protein [Paenibacillus phyllosphaerae]MBB3110816.1 hypothetical protein [Paenibacillus phyllosphaerae]
MLHIVNGDAVAEKLKQGVVQGDILVWREVYPEGPVFLQPEEADHRRIRATYLDQAMGIPQEEFTRLSEAQERQLAEFRHYDEVVLWFEHDLFDQTMLAYLLHWFEHQNMGKTKLSLLCIGSYPGIELFRGLGQLSVQQMGTLAGTWHPLGSAELALGSRLWEAYTGSDLAPLAELLESDLSALPFAKEAFMAHLSRLPSARNGLGSVEQLTLEYVAGGLQEPFKLFDQVGGVLHQLGMGDLQYWHCLRTLTLGEAPLLRLEGEADFPGFKDSPVPFGQSRLSLTETGEQVLRGELDYMEIADVDRWFGGYHLIGKDTPWQWDTERKTVVRYKP